MSKQQIQTLQEEIAILRATLSDIGSKVATALIDEGVCGWDEGGRLGDALLAIKDTVEEALTDEGRQVLKQQYRIGKERMSRSEKIQSDNAIQEITSSTWLNKPVIATFGGTEYLVGMNGLAALNYKELEEEARVLVEPIYDRLLMGDLGLEEAEDGEVTLTVSLDDDIEEAEDEQETTGLEMSGHNFFTCPETLAARAIFLHVGMRVRGRYIGREQVTGDISSGNWSSVTLRGEDTKEYSSVPVNTLEMLT